MNSKPGLRLAMKPTGEQRELIVNTWNSLGAPPITVKILNRIQRALAQAIGPQAVVSPASIARVLTDEGAELHHPDVIESDARWREKRLKQSALRARTDLTKPLTLSGAQALLKQFEKLRQEPSVKNDREELRRLSEAARNEKARAQLLAQDVALSDVARKAQREIAEWFRVWLQTPEIFNDWLDLRQRSPEFRETFGAYGN